MMKPGGFLKKVFNPGNVAGKVHKAVTKVGGAVHKAAAAPAKAIFGGGKKKPAAGKPMGSIFGGKKGEKMNALIAKRKEPKPAPTAMS